MRALIRTAALLATWVAAPAFAADSLTELRQGFEAIEAWRIDDAREIAQRWYAQQPDDPMVLALVAEVKLHMSDYAGAVEFFDRARKSGAPEALLHDRELAEHARTATKDYAETVSDHFIIRHSAGKDSILVPYALETLEAARDKIGTLLGWKPDSRVVVEFYPTAATLAAVSTLTPEEIKHSGTIALCKWNRLMVTTPRAIVYGYAWRDTVAHELTHLMIGGASRNTVPIWLHEGLAKFAETAWRGDPGTGLSIHQQELLVEKAKKGQLIPFAKMHPSMAKLKSQEETGLAFAEVFTFIEYLVELKGWAAIREVLKKMSAGTPDEEAIAEVFGTPLKTLSDRWMGTLKTRRVRREGAPVGPDREVVVKAKPDTPDDNLHGLSKEGRRFARAADLLYTRGRIKAAQKELTKAFEVTHSPLISSKLSQVALAAGDLEAAESAARSAIAGSADLAGPYVTLAEILVTRKKLEEARDPLARAVAINPFDPRIHALTLAVLGDKGDAKARAHAQIALAMLTQHAELARPPPLGTGGLVTIDGVPFSRVFVERTGLTPIPTSMITPTGALLLKPGTVTLRLVPPTGAEILRTVTIEPRKADGDPQKIAPDMRGS